MTARRDEPNSGTTVSTAAAEVPASVSRRRLVRDAAVCLPTILTLNSGAALAATSSRVINLAANAPPDAQGRLLCLDTATVDIAGNPDKPWTIKYKVIPGTTQVNAIPTARQYYDEVATDAAGVTSGQYPLYQEIDGAQEVCSQSLTKSAYYYDALLDGTFTEANLNAGGRISASALASFGTSIIIREI